MTLPTPPSPPLNQVSSSPSQPSHFIHRTSSHLPQQAQHPRDNDYANDVVTQERDTHIERIVQSDAPDTVMVCVRPMIHVHRLKTIQPLCNQYSIIDILLNTSYLIIFPKQQCLVFQLGAMHVLSLQPLGL